jgi:hypothetical protein
MDADHFDAVCRTWLAAPSRRGFLGLGVAGGLTAFFEAFEGEARKKKRKKKKKHKRKCTPQCTGKACGVDGCEGSCGTCGACQACQNGQCAVQPDSTPCGDLRQCLSGQCVCLGSHKPCNGGCCEGCLVDGAFTGTCLPDTPECPAGSTKVNSSCDNEGSCCACPAGQRLCNGSCVQACQLGRLLNDACQCVGELP